MFFIAFSVLDKVHHASVVNLVAKGVNLLAEKEKVDLVASIVCLGSRGHVCSQSCLIVTLAGGLAQLLICLHHVLLPLRLIHGQAFRRLNSLMHMVAKVVLRRQFKQVSVESGHIRLNVIEEVRLLHVTAVQFDWNLLEQLRNSKVLRVDLRLHNLGCNTIEVVALDAILDSEARNSFHRQTVSLKRIHTVIALLRVIDDHH